MSAALIGLLVHASLRTRRHTCDYLNLLDNVCSKVCTKNVAECNN